MTLYPRLLALVMSGVLGLIALLHLLWAFGVSFPRGDRESLARTVIGARGRDGIMPSPLSCVVVALVIAALAALPLLQAAVVITPLPWDGIQRVGWVVAVIFLLRGVASFTPVWRARFPGQPFATLDCILYGPLCLALAAGFIALEYCYSL